MEFLAPWFESSETHLVDELHRELPAGHVLKNVEVSVVARRHDRDDVLYALDVGSARLALVHLTWGKAREVDMKWPTTKFFDNHQSWLEYMISANQAFLEPDHDRRLRNPAQHIE
jgi:hypothetical protein